MKKDNWYKKKRRCKNDSTKDYKSVIFVQPTRDSVLKRKYEEVIEKSKCPVRVVERAGKSVSQKLQKSYPFSKNKCSSMDCFVCESEGKGNCLRENVNYEVECVREGCDYVYLGETCRNAWSRGKEHLRGIQKKDSDSVFVEHIRECHDSVFVHGACFGFKMNVRESHKTALERQITEAVKINTSTKQILNRKSGFRANAVLSLSSSLSTGLDTPRA